MEVKFLIAILAGIVLSAYLYQRMTNWKHVRRRDSAKRVAKRIAQIHESGQIFAYLRKIDPFVFEELLLDAFEACEIKVIRNQRYTGDGGVDGHIFFDGHVIPIQAKRYRQHISLEHVRQFAALVERRHAPFGLFIHTGVTGKGSYQAAQKSSVVFISGERLIRLLRRDPEYIQALLRNRIGV